MLACLLLVLLHGGAAQKSNQPGEITPKHYVAYKLAPGERIVLDGKLDDKAWQEVAWTSDFQVILCEFGVFHAIAALRSHQRTFEALRMRNHAS